MKNKSSIILLSALLALTSCGGKSSTSNSESSSITTSSIEDKTITYSFKLKNVLDGYVDTASIYLNDTKIEPLINGNIYSFETLYKENNLLKISHEKYEDIIVPLKGLDGDLGEFSFDYKFVNFGELTYNSSLLRSDFKASSTRSLNYLRFEFESPYNNFINSDNELHLYVNTGKTSTKLGSGDYLFKLRSNDFVVYDYGFVHDYTDLNLFNYSVKNVENKTVVNLDIPYTYLGIRYRDVIGVNYLEYLASKDLSIPMIFDEKVIDINDTKNYERINYLNDYFANNVNENNPSWISKAKKRELIKDKIFSFADPYYNAHKEADDVYFSLDYTKESLDFSFVGFGDFTSEEYFKLIIHNNILDGQAWNLINGDVVINIYKDRYEVFYGVNFMFGIEQMHLQANSTTPINSFVDYTNHFTMKVSIPISLVSNVTSLYDDIYIMMLEFGRDGVFYEGADVNNNFFYDRVTLGDPAFMTSYKCIDAPQKRTCKLTLEEKAAIIGDRKINFADPLDVNFEKADDFYMKTIRNESSLTFDIVGFGDFSDTEIINFVLHTSDNDGNDWAIQTSDVSLMLSNSEAGFVTNTTDYWVATRMSRAQKKATNPVEYVRYDDYFTLRFTVNYGEINSSITSATPIKSYPIEFGFGGVIYNTDPWIKAMRLNGEPCGDPAYQKYYINL